MNLTPNHIMVLLHIYAFVDKIPRNDASAVKGAIEDFARHDIITLALNKDIDHGFKLTGRGEKLVSMILNTPLPEIRYIDPREDNV